MSALLELAERCERATGADRALMCSAFKAVFPEVSDGAWDAIDAWDARYDRFCAMLDVGAHESAALMLVPEDHGWALHQLSYSPVAWLVRQGPDFAVLPSVKDAATPALALTAASLRALAAAQPKGQRDGG